jgi:hypothetical protein
MIIAYIILAVIAVFGGLALYVNWNEKRNQTEFDD